MQGLRGAERRGFLNAQEPSHLAPVDETRARTIRRRRQPRSHYRVSVARHALQRPARGHTATRIDAGRLTRRATSRSAGSHCSPERIRSARMARKYVVEVSDAAWLTGSGRSHWAWLAVVVGRRGLVPCPESGQNQAATGEAASARTARWQVARAMPVCAAIAAQLSPLARRAPIC